MGCRRACATLGGSAIAGVGSPPRLTPEKPMPASIIRARTIFTEPADRRRWHQLDEGAVGGPARRPWEDLTGNVSWLHA